MNTQDSILFAHYSEVPKSLWRWPNFTPQEIACHCPHKPRCKGHGSILIVPYALDNLQALRSHIGKPFKINSAYRSPEHNAKVDGKTGSKHPLGIAFDISLDGLDRHDLCLAARNFGFNGRGQYNTFVHLDCRETEAMWDKRGE